MTKEQRDQDRRATCIAACSGLPEEISLCASCRCYFTIETGITILSLTDDEYEVESYGVDAAEFRPGCAVCAKRQTTN